VPGNLLSILEAVIGGAVQSVTSTIPGHMQPLPYPNFTSEQ
jgi:hypothetical protein